MLLQTTIITTLPFKQNLAIDNTCAIQTRNEGEKNEMKGYPDLENPLQWFVPVDVHSKSGAADRVSTVAREKA